LHNGSILFRIGPKSGDTNLKRHRVIGILGFFALLLATSAVTPFAPAARTDVSGFQPTGRHQSAALDDTRQGLVIRNADPLVSNLSRFNPSSPHGIVPQSIVPILLDAQGFGIADLLPVSARESGFHSLLRAPPASLLT
jgi:hypothetical protein